MHENKGFLRFPAQRANARVADFAPLAGISLPFPFRSASPAASAFVQSKSANCRSRLTVWTKPWFSSVASSSSAGFAVAAV